MIAVSMKSAAHDEEKKQRQTTVDILRLGADGNETSRQPVEIRIENLSLASTTQTSCKTRRGFFSGQADQGEFLAKTYLKNLDFAIPPAQLTAILGSSGSGKTSLLNVLVGRTPAKLTISGNVYFNGARNPPVHKINAISGYVRQEDGSLLSHLTVRQTLQYAIELYTKETPSALERDSKAEEIIDLVGLQDCADVLVGDDETTGCSGGQKRRVSIGIQLVNDPTCLFLDEPTTGLDARTALSIVQTLKKLASRGQTVVCSVHQPRQEIWDTFDNVMLLMPGGQLAYAGKTSDTLEHFARAGYDLPKSPIHQRDIAFREISDGAYGASSFLLSYMAVELPLSFLSALASTGVIFAVTGLQATSSDGVDATRNVLSMILVLFAYITTGESLGIAYSAWLGEHGGLGVALMNSTVLWLSFMAGFLVSTLPPALNYLNYGSIFKYSAVVLSLNEFEALKPLEIASTDGAAVEEVGTPFRDGQTVLQFLNFADQKMGLNLAMVIVLMVAYRLLAWLCLEARVRTMFSRKSR
ncbi:hypothetical protein EMPS_10172 [Entomortierella parvispora]|uniref:ABC transporter domain-containing protein n=1 Tax=Entomortierella parvispora TaxID=205924 RepID=A0A9P3M103_9FUNG|nr:hypothetical protein EMPS_10172 [Entomortierella parvispora]